ncbi:MAG: hypothetical protein OJF55_002564 [Rhodanobacteraceae bacterium]|nr:MAG: hypothetical protein OJF55_002564 [Rhodanobacteraceae bacterium]
MDSYGYRFDCALETIAKLADGGSFRTIRTGIPWPPGC